MEQAIAVVGGDARMAYVAELLRADGKAVSTWGLEGAGAPCAVPLGRALAAKILILPLPVCRGGELNLPLTETTLSCARLWPQLRPDQILLGGMVGNLPTRLQEEFGLELLDYYAPEEVQVLNAVPTAEGAIALAMEMSDRTLWGSRCLVLGAGRVGKALAWRLKALGAETAVAARKRADRAWGKVWGCESQRVDTLADYVEQFDFVFNTIPSLVLDAATLAQVRPDCAILDLASRPGGVDGAAATALGRRVIAAPGLPGKVAPRTAAGIIQDSIYHILEERGEPI